MRTQYAPYPVDENLDLIVNGALDSADLDLFNLRAFQDLHVPDALRSFHSALIDRRTRAVIATVHFHEPSAGDMASPFRGSFGGFALAPASSLTRSGMDSFVGAVERHLVSEGATRLSVVMPPLAYHLHETSAWLDILMHRGFSVSRHELSYGIEVVGQFVDRIDSGNRKRLQKCVRDGLVASPIPRSEYESAYRVVAENRSKRGYTLSMSWPTFVAMVEAMPDRVACFAVKRGSDPIAAALCLRINHHALYVAHWGEIAGVEAWSPVTFLASHLFDYCLAADIRLLDLGTANVDGAPNHGLIRYKKNLGCLETLKLTLQKPFS